MQWKDTTVIFVARLKYVIPLSHRLDWSVKTWITIAGLPAFLYTIQNVAALMAYQNLESLTFNVLNQTKILSAALSCYFVLGKRRKWNLFYVSALQIVQTTTHWCISNIIESNMQIVSLLVLITSTLVIEQILHPGVFTSLMTLGGEKSVWNGIAGSMANGGGRHVTHGVVPVMVASLISGMAGALTQKGTQGVQGDAPVWGKRRSVKSRPPRNAYLFSMEMSVASVILLLASLGMNSNGRDILRSPSTFFSNWTPGTFIPVITSSIGGILVGLVTKHAGSVRKGFALIFGLLLSGIFQARETGIGSHQIAGGLLAATSLWMHTVHPYKPPPAADKDA